ncbi:MAG: single-stranded DNA-binding protein, partial [Deltaproteobacteria bacterium]|nr:single-stranded DNA-binding protein [Deltaproteobacteria bacterium]
MSKSLNKVQIIGYLGQAPELKVTTKGKSWTTFTIATTDGTGDYTRVNWHKIVLWGKTAENAVKYLEKGSQLYVEGVLGYNEYAKGGAKVVEAQITGFNLIFMGS